MNDNKELIRIFDVDDEDVESIHIELVDDHYEVSMKFVSHVQCCRNCGSIRIVSKGNHRRKLVSSPLNERPCFILTSVKRYQCKDCGTSFLADNPIAYRDSKFTRTAIIGIIDRLSRYTATYSEIARNYGVSAKKISDIFDELVRVKRHDLPRILLIDEFFFGRKARYKYPVILMDYETRIIIDIVESRKHDVLSYYLFRIPLEEREKVEFICIDMSFTFRPLLKTFFKNSTILVDHFHVV